MAFSFASPPQFSTPQQSTPFPSSFQQQQQSFSFQPQQQQQQQPQVLLYTEEKAPAGYGARWEDLHPDCQKFLLQIEERILEYKDESQRLDQCSRLHDSSISSDNFELDANHIMQHRNCKRSYCRDHCGWSYSALCGYWYMLCSS